MKSILITGCNRGIGLGMIQHLVKHSNAPTNIIATCRNLDGATELQKLSDAHKNIKILILDIRKPETFNDFAKQVEEIVGDDGLNVLFNNAAIAPKNFKIEEFNADEMMETYTVNTIGPLLLSKALVPMLKRASEKNKMLPLSSSRAAIFNMTSGLASIELNTFGGLYEYRCSKVAINMATKLLSIELKDDGIIVTCMDPGWVQTELGGANAILTVDQSVSGLIKAIYNLNENQNGHFLRYEGPEQPW